MQFWQNKVRRNAFKKGEWTTVVLPDVAKYPDGEYWQLKEYDEIENKVYFSEISDRKNSKETLHTCSNRRQREESQERRLHHGKEEGNSALTAHGSRLRRRA